MRRGAIENVGESPEQEPGSFPTRWDQSPSARENALAAKTIAHRAGNSPPRKTISHGPEDLRRARDNIAQGVNLTLRKRLLNIQQAHCVFRFLIWARSRAISGGDQTDASAVPKAA
jgi:hypothetical protein